MRKTLLALALLASSTAAQLSFAGQARVDFPPLPTGPRLHVVWLSETAPPIILMEDPRLPLAFPNTQDFLQSVYVATNGAVITVFVDCSKKSTDECLRSFKNRFEEMTKLLPIDKEATARYLKPTT